MAEHKRPDIIPGYEHPTSTNYSTSNSIYKTFTEGQKNVKNKEKFGNTSVGKQYASYGDYDEDLCPVCNKSPNNTCPCAYNDKRCDNSHVWYTNRDGKIKIGNPH